MKTKRTGTHAKFPHRTCNQKIHVVVVQNNGKEMYSKKMCVWVFFVVVATRPNNFFFCCSRRRHRLVNLELPTYASSRKTRNI